MNNAIIIDLETAPLENAAAYLDPVEASKNLKDPEKIKADLERREREQITDCGLDWNLNRIVCAGLWNPDTEEGPTMWACPDEVCERATLEAIALRLQPHYRPTIVGFCVRRFDVPVILQRARYLGVKMPRISLKRWDNPHITDIYDLLTFDDQPCTSVMRRTLSSFCRRFGVEVPEDASSGNDIAAMVAAGDWSGVAAHCEADMHKTAALARRVGVLQAQEPVGIL